MLCFDRIHVSEGTDVNKTIALHECVACHYRYFLEINFRFQKVCNGCHDVFSIMISISLYDIAILFITFAVFITVALSMKLTKVKP